MSINTIVEQLKKQIESFENTVQLEEVGKVIEVGDAIARLSGLTHCQSNEMLEFPNDTFGVALNLEEETIGAVLLGEYAHIKQRQMYHKIMNFGFMGEVYNNEFVHITGNFLSFLRFVPSSCFTF